MDLNLFESVFNITNKTEHAFTAKKLYNRLFLAVFKDGGQFLRATEELNGATFKT